MILALTSLEAAVVGLKDGSIEFQLLSLILDHSEQFFVVYEEICKDGSEKAMLKQLLDQRNRELTAFEIERQEILSFISRRCLTIKQGKLHLILRRIHQRALCSSTRTSLVVSTLHSTFLNRTLFVSLLFLIIKQAANSVVLFVFLKC